MGVALKFLHLNIKFSQTGRKSFAFSSLLDCKNGTGSHGLLAGTGAFVWKVASALIRPPPLLLALLSEEFLSGVYRSCQPCSPTCTNRSVHARCVITVRAASAVGCSRVLLHALFVHLDSSSSGCFHNNGRLIDRVCPVPDRNYRVNRNIYFQQLVIFRLLSSPASNFILHSCLFKWHISVQVIDKTVITKRRSVWKKSLKEKNQSSSQLNMVWKTS